MVWTEPGLLYAWILCAYRIIAALSKEERGLFRERIRFLDKKIHPGLGKLTWSYKGALEGFIPDCRIHANAVRYC